MLCLGAFCAGAFPAIGADDAKIAALKERLAKEIDTAPNATDKVKAFAKEKLIPLCTNRVFVEEVKRQNDAKTPLAQIQAIDAEWIKAEDELPIHQQKLNNACAKEIKRLAGELRVLTEVFVMDNQGANVGQNELTSDYWQGDEPKWQKSFNGGKGGVDISDRKFDKSANAEDQKISLPIIDEQGEVVGAVCFGLKADQL
jgi:hypothetical protein